MSEQKTLAELEALKNRMEHDIRRSNAIDFGGLNRNTPLMKNYEQVQRQIKELKEKN